MTGETTQTKLSQADGAMTCPMLPASASAKKVNPPIQAKKYVPKSVRPTALERPGENGMDEFSYTEIVDVPVVETTLDRLGKWLGPFNIVPFFNALECLVDNIKTMRKKQAAAPGQPCIRCNIGQDCVMLTGNTAVHWMLSQPLDNVDRDHFNWGFGPFGAGWHYVRKSIPCLIASEKDGHSKMRKHITAVMEKRLPNIDAVIEETFTYRLNQMIDGFAKDSNFITLKDAGSWLSGYFVTMWLLGSEPPSNRSMEEFGAKCLAKTNTDNWIGNFLGQRLADVLLTLDGSYAREDALIKMVRTSRYYKQYESMAKELGIEMQDFDRNLTFSICLSGGLGLALPFGSVIASLGENLGSVSELRQELGMDNLTIESVGDVTKYPLLDALMWEVKRAYIRGMWVPRRAKKDLLMPGGNGKAYRIKKGDLLIGYYPLAMRDPTVFDNPNRFHPRRYLDNPELKKHTFPFGLPSEFDPAHAEWGCPTYAMGFGDQLLKVFMGKWLQRVEWSMIRAPDFMGNAIGEFRPYDIPFATLKYRKAYLDSLN